MAGDTLRVLGKTRRRARAAVKENVCDRLQDCFCCFPYALPDDDNCGTRCCKVCCYGTANEEEDCCLRCMACCANTGSDPVTLDSEKVRRLLKIDEKGTEFTVAFLYTFASKLKRQRDIKQFTWKTAFGGWFTAVMMWVVCVAVGMWVFVEIEQDNYDRLVTEHTAHANYIRNALPVADKMTDIITALQADNANDNSALISDLQTIQGTYQTEDFFDQNVDEITYRYYLENPWDYGGATYYVLTVMTTVGYGNFTVKTDEGRIAVIIYSIFGIMCFVWLMRWNIAIARNGCGCHCPCIEADYRYDPNVFVDVVIGIMMLAIFLFGSAAVFDYREGLHGEDWNYIEGLYFSWVTISTIGFGDYTHDTSDNLTNALVLLFLFLGLHVAAFFLASVEEMLEWLNVGRDLHAMLADEGLQNLRIESVMHRNQEGGTDNAMVEMQAGGSLKAKV